MRRASLEAPAAGRQTHFACLRWGRRDPSPPAHCTDVRSRGACLSTAPAHHHLTIHTAVRWDCRGGREGDAMPKLIWLPLLLAIAGFATTPSKAADEPDLIFKRSTVFKLLTPNDKLATYGLDDPEVEGVACHFTVPERGRRQGVARRRRGGLRHFARLPADRPDPLQGEVRAGRRRVSQAPLAVLQEDADRARLRRQAQRAGLHGLFRPPDRRLAEEFDLVGADHALGPERPNPALRGFRREIDRRSPSQRGSVNAVVPERRQLVVQLRHRDRAPAISSEVTYEPTSERVTVSPRFSRMRRAALYMR